MLSGLLLFLLGLLLLLPIPLTNYIFGSLLLLFALALLARDGTLMIVAWNAGASAIAVFRILRATMSAAQPESTNRISRLRPSYIDESEATPITTPPPKTHQPTI